MKSIWCVVCSMYYFKLHKSVSQGDQGAKGEIPDIVPVIVVQCRDIFLPTGPEFIHRWERHIYQVFV